MKDWIWRWSPAVIIMLIIFIASSTPGSDLPKFGTWDLFTKKGGHMLGYALLASAFFRALNKGRKVTSGNFLAAVSLSCLYAISDEFHQRFTPGRGPSVRDVGIDMLGAALGLIAFSLIKKLQKSGVRSQESESGPA